MNPSPDRVQCPYCLGYRRLKHDGTMYAHDRNGGGYRKNCPGTHLTKEEAKAAKAAGSATGFPSDPAGRIEPEDIF